MTPPQLDDPTGIDRVTALLAAGLEVRDADIEMHHHELLTVDAWPHGWPVVRIPLHLDLHVTRGRPQHRPAVAGRLARSWAFAANDRPTQQSLVELGERDRIRRIQRGA